MNYKFLSALALLFSIYTGVKAEAPSKATESPQVAPSNVKIGYVDVEYVLEHFPEAKKNSTEIQGYQKQLENQFQAKYKAFQEKAQTLQQQSDLLTNEQRQQSITELQSLEGELYRFQQDQQNKISNKYQELMGPIHRKIEEVIKKIAVQYGYNFILNKNTQAGPVVLFADKAADLSEMVLEKLKAMVPKAPQPPVVGPKHQTQSAGASAKIAKKK